MTHPDTPELSSRLTLATPADIIFYLLDEATKRNDNPETTVEFGFSGNTFWHHKNLDTRIDEYVERLLAKRELEGQFEVLDRLDRDPQMFGDWQQVIEDLRVELKEKHLAELREELGRYE